MNSFLCNGLNGGGGARRGTWEAPCEQRLWLCLITGASRETPELRARARPRLVVYSLQVLKCKLKLKRSKFRFSLILGQERTKEIVLKTRGTHRQRPGSGLTPPLPSGCGRARVCALHASRVLCNVLVSVLLPVLPQRWIRLKRRAHANYVSSSQETSHPPDAHVFSHVRLVSVANEAVGPKADKESTETLFLLFIDVPGGSSGRRLWSHWD